MGKTTTLEGLPNAIMEILKQYDNDVKDNLVEITEKIGKKGAQAVRKSASGAVNGKKYAGSWTSKMQGARVASWSVIYSKKAGLPHLLEFGHALRQGSRTAARPHIKPVEQQLIEEIEHEGDVDNE